MRQRTLLTVALATLAAGLLATCGSGGTGSRGSVLPVSSPAASTRPGQLALGAFQDFATPQGATIRVTVQEVTDPATSAQEARPPAGQRLVDVTVVAGPLAKPGSTSTAMVRVSFDGPSSLVMTSTDGASFTPWPHSKTVPWWDGFSSAPGASVTGTATFALPDGAKPRTLTVELGGGAIPAAVTWLLEK